MGRLMVGGVGGRTEKGRGTGPSWAGTTEVRVESGNCGSWSSFWSPPSLDLARPSPHLPACPPPQDDNFNNTAGLYDIWLQQIKTSWREVPNNTSAASRLTPELKDLLDKMFDVKQVR